MDKVYSIRQFFYEQGKTIAEIIEETGHGRKTIVKYLDQTDFKSAETNHLFRTYRAFLEGFIMLQIHNSFGNPISIDESFEISMNVLISGMEQYRR